MPCGDVALGTLYRYFPSKIHLLVSALAREFERTQERLDRTPIPGETPYERTLFVLGRVTRAMQREPQLTEAMTRAFMFADPSAAAEVNAVARMMEHMFTRAMHDGEPTADDKAIARVIGDVWLSNLVAWVTRRASANDVVNHLELATRLLLRVKRGRRWPVRQRAATTAAARLSRSRAANLAKDAWPPRRPASPPSRPSGPASAGPLNSISRVTWDPAPDGSMKNRLMRLDTHRAVAGHARAARCLGGGDPPGDLGRHAHQLHPLLVGGPLVERRRDVAGERLVHGVPLGHRAGPRQVSRPARAPPRWSTH